MDLPTVVPPDFSDGAKWQIIGYKEKAIHGQLEQDDQNHRHFSFRICRPGEADSETRIGAVHYYRFWDRRIISGEEVVLFGQSILKIWGFAHDGNKRCLAIKAREDAWDNATGLDCEYNLKPIFSGEKLIGILFDVWTSGKTLLCSFRVMKKEA